MADSRKATEIAGRIRSIFAAYDDADISAAIEMLDQGTRRFLAGAATPPQSRRRPARQDIRAGGDVYAAGGDQIIGPR